MTDAGKIVHVRRMAGGYLTACSVSHGEYFAGDAMDMIGERDTDPQAWRAVERHVIDFAIEADGLLRWLPPRVVGWRLWHSEHRHGREGFLGLRNHRQPLTVAELNDVCLHPTDADRTYAAFNEAMGKVHLLAATVTPLPLRLVGPRRYIVDASPRGDVAVTDSRPLINRCEPCLVGRCDDCTEQATNAPAGTGCPCLDCHEPVPPPLATAGGPAPAGLEGPTAAGVAPADGQQGGQA